MTLFSQPTHTARSGALTPFSLPALLREAKSTRHTGFLHILDEQRAKLLYFSEGLLVYVRSNIILECLGRFLVRTGVITLAQCEESLAILKQTGQKQGEILLGMGVLSLGNLRRALQMQERDKLIELFTWNRGEFHWLPETTNHPPPPVRIPMDADLLIADGLSTTLENHVALGLLQEHLYAYLVPQHQPLELWAAALHPEEIPWLQESCAGIAVAEALDLAASHFIPTPQARLYALYQAGFLAFQPTPPVESQPLWSHIVEASPPTMWQPSGALHFVIEPFEATPPPTFVAPPQPLRFSGELPFAPQAQASSDALELLAVEEVFEAEMELLEDIVLPSLEPFADDPNELLSLEDIAKLAATFSLPVDPTDKPNP